MAYSNEVIDHYENPRNVGVLDKKDEAVGTGLVGAPACGDVLKLQIKVDIVISKHLHPLQWHLAFPLYVGASLPPVFWQKRISHSSSQLTHHLDEIELHP